MAKKDAKPVADDAQASVLAQGTETPESGSPPETVQEASGEMENAGMWQTRQPSPDQGEAQQEGQTGQSDKQHVATYKITCRNKISKVIGGVSFVNGVGYTSDGFTASWFGNKDGYEVKEAGF